jgi:hypothetical protein
VSDTIRFRRPETPYGISRMFVPTGTDTGAQVRLLEKLGYMIVDVSPTVAEPKQRLPQRHEPSNPML